MNAIDFLVQEHNKIRKIFSDLDNPSHDEDTKKNLFLTLRDELIRHEEMEQTVWYPKLHANKQWQERIQHLKAEEHSAKKFMAQLKNDKNSREWQKGLAQLRDEIEHHATEEETKLFPHVKDILDEHELQRIGQEMQEFKENYSVEK